MQFGCIISQWLTCSTPFISDLSLTRYLMLFKNNMNILVLVATFFLSNLLSFLHVTDSHQLDGSVFSWTTNSISLIYDAPSMHSCVKLWLASTRTDQFLLSYFLPKLTQFDKYKELLSYLQAKLCCQWQSVTMKSEIL